MKHSLLLALVAAAYIALIAACIAACVWAVCICSGRPIRVRGSLDQWPVCERCGRLMDTPHDCNNNNAENGKETTWTK